MAGLLNVGEMGALALHVLVELAVLKEEEPEARRTVQDFHAKYLKNRPVVIACPKLEDNDPQIAKLSDIVRVAQPAALTVLRMEVPCCGGLVRVAEEAVKPAGADIPVKTVVIGVDGREK